MTEVSITVRGEHELRIAPERATVHLSVSLEGPDRTKVVDRTLALAAPVREGIVARHDGGSIAEWTSRSLNVRADRPWNSTGKRLAPVYTASVEFTATFADISEMSVWATDISGWDGVSLGYTDWHLTPETEAEVEREVAAQAVGVAVARATAYANALGLTTVTPVEIADHGLISAAPAPPQGAKMRSLAASADAMETMAMDFQGEEITVSATVEARFTAR